MHLQGEVPLSKLYISDLKKVYYEMTEADPLSSKIFTFRVDPFLESVFPESTHEVTKAVSLVKMAEIYRQYPAPSKKKYMYVNY